MKKLALFGILILALAAWWWYDHGLSQEASSDTTVSALVTTAPIKMREVSKTVKAYGVVAPSVDGLTSISTPRAAKLEQLMVVQGETVKAGTALAKLARDPEGNLTYRQAVSALSSAKSDLVQIKELLPQQLATNAQLAAAKKAVKDAESALAAQNALGNNQATQTIVAPFDGVVTSLVATKGDRLAAGATLMQIAASNAWQARLDVEPDSGRHVTSGMQVMLDSVFNSSAGGSEELSTTKGQVVHVQRMIDPITQMIQVLVNFAPGDASIMPGDSVVGDIVIDKREMLAVPASAILSNEMGSSIFQVKGGTAKQASVTRELESGGYVGISGEFDATLPVVVSGNYELQDGIKIRKATGQTHE